MVEFLRAESTTSYLYKNEIAIVFPYPIFTVTVDTRHFTNSIIHNENHYFRTWLKDKDFYNRNLSSEMFMSENIENMKRVVLNETTETMVIVYKV